MSKGSNKRPTDVPRETFESNWEKIFGCKTESKTPGNGKRQNTGKSARKPS